MAFARVDPPQPQHQRQYLLLFAYQIRCCRLTCSREIAYRLVSFIWNPNAGELAGAQQFDQIENISAIGLHPIARPDRDQRGRRHHTIVTETGNQPI
jgi:hypothetical protein